MQTFYRTQDLGSYRHLDDDRSCHLQAFRKLLFAEPGICGRVLDIGCGPKLPGVLSAVSQLAAQLDGVDPSPEIDNHPNLSLRWHGTFEQSPLPQQAYDLAYAFNVVEHIATPKLFFQKLRTVLKPGAVFWALTPHAPHPFCKLARVIEVLGFKQRIAEKHSNVNNYSSYYRLNKGSHIVRDIAGLGFASAIFYSLPCLQWDTYFAPKLRWLPHLYDRALGTRFRSCMLILAYRLEADRS